MLLGIPTNVIFDVLVDEEVFVSVITVREIALSSG